MDAQQVLVETDKCRGGRLHSFHKHNNCGIEWMSRVNIGHDSAKLKSMMEFHNKFISNAVKYNSPD